MQRDMIDKELSIFLSFIVIIALFYVLRECFNSSYGASLCGNNAPFYTLPHPLFSSVFRFVFAQHRFTHRAHLYFVRMEISLNFASHSSYLTPFSTYSDFSKLMKILKLLNIMKIFLSQIPSLSLPYRKSLVKIKGPLLFSRWTKCPLSQLCSMLPRKISSLKTTSRH